MTRAAKTRPVRIMIVDDHPMVRIGLRTLLDETEGLEVVAEADTLASAESALAQASPDLMLLDLRLPDGLGSSRVSQFKSLCPGLRVIILTSYDDQSSVVQSITAGVDGYLLKQVDNEGLVEGILRVMAGTSVLDPAIASQIIHGIQATARGSPERRMRLLSRQERRVLAQVAEGMTNKEIAAALNLSDKTVKNYLSNILDKLEVSRRTEAAAFYARYGDAISQHGAGNGYEH